MSDVFISYSRKDGDFAERLTNTLKRAQRDVWIDWEDIPRGADWLQEIFAGIDAADTFVFIVSQYSLQSEICNDELAYARKNNKRIVPLIRQEIDENLESDIRDFWAQQNWQKAAQDNWTDIGHLNWIFFNDDDKFDAEFAALIETINTDLEHVKLHTRYLVRARDWETGGNNPSFLLIGDEIDSAENWLSSSTDKTPEATQLHREYIATSRERDLAEKRRLRNLRLASGIAAVVGLIAIIASVVAYFSAQDAQMQRDSAYNAGTSAAYDATVFSLRQEVVSTLSSGGAVIAVHELEATPDAFIATVTANAELVSFEPVVSEFDGVEMVQVPAGCFWMGSVTFENEQPIHEICFDEAFWIDRYEVSNEQFERLNGVANNPPYWPEPKHPRTALTWFEARDYCALRGAKLPTEAEWEYAARGIDSLKYPWGNAFIAENVVYAENSDNVVAVVDSKVEGASWVGALHMSGNVWEWTSTIYDEEQFPYPYNADDGREDLTRTGAFRVLRGSSILGGVFNYGVVGQTNIGLDLRGAWRLKGIVDLANDDVGVRCVRSE